MDKRIFFWGIVCLFLAACGGNSYKQVFKAKESFNSKTYSVASKLLYSATIRALYSTNFLIEQEDEAKGLINAKRLFQNKKQPAVVIQARIAIDEENKSTLYLTALQTSEREGQTAVEDVEFFQDFFAVVSEQIRAARAVPEAAGAGALAGEATIETEQKNQPERGLGQKESSI